MRTLKPTRVRKPTNKTMTQSNGIRDLVQLQQRQNAFWLSQRWLSLESVFDSYICL
jgi:hypothetical protein